MPALSVVVLTKNEEAFIGRCIRSVPFADEVVVLDSGSTDRTQEIAREHGAVVHEREWPGNWAVQRNRGIDLAEHDWVLYLDADEIVTPRLGRSIQAVLGGAPDPKDGYYPIRRGDSMGRLLPNTKRPSRQKGLVRLFDRRHNRFDESMDVHEECHPAGRALPLEGPLLHWRGCTLEENIESLNFYSGIEAGVMTEDGVEIGARHLVAKPVLRFLWSYVAKGFFRKGMPGLIAALRMAFHEFTAAAKAWEQQHVPEPVRHPPARIYQDHQLEAAPGANAPSANAPGGKNAPAGKTSSAEKASSSPSASEERAAVSE